MTKICKEERQKLPLSELLDQTRCLKLYMRPGEQILYPQLDYAIKLASEVELQIEKMEDQDILIFSTMMHLVHQNKR